jgi:hypothetical protein
MKTTELIGLLASGAGPAVRVNPMLRLAPSVVGGALAAALLSIGLLGLVPAHMLGSPALWIKLAYAGLLVGGALRLTARLALPLSHVRAPAMSVVGVVAGMALLGGAALFAAAPGERVEALLGRSWYRCPLIIPGVALPALAALLFTLRGMAPTRLRAAGLAAGLLAGALGAIGYSLHCPEQSLAFVAVWYTLGIVLSGALGALLGPRALRW